jgi:hypothetical protein
VGSSKKVQIRAGEKMMLYFKEWNTVINYTGRDFKIGDNVYLREWNKDRGYTGREIRVVITYIRNGEFTEDGTCLMSAECVQYKDTRPVWQCFIDWLHFVKKEKSSPPLAPLKTTRQKKREFPKNEYCDV